MFDYDHQAYLIIWSMIMYADHHMRSHWSACSQKSASALRDRWIGWEGDLQITNHQQQMWNIQVTTYLIQIIVIQMQIQQIKNHEQEIEISKCKLQITPTANPRWFVVNVCKNIRSAMIFQPQCYLASRFLGNLSRVWAREGKSGRSLNDGK